MAVPLELVRRRLDAEPPAPAPPPGPAIDEKALAKLFPATTWTPEGVSAPPPAPLPVAPPRARPLGFIEVGTAGPEAPAVRSPLKTASEAEPSGWSPEDAERATGRIEPLTSAALADPSEASTEAPTPPPPSDPTPSPSPTPVPTAVPPPVSSSSGVPPAEEPAWETTAPPTGPLPDQKPAPAPVVTPLRRAAGLWALRVLPAVLLLGVGVAYGEYRSLVAQLPPLGVIKDYRPPIVSEVRAPDGQLIGKFFEEERYVVDLKEVPEQVQHAFLAAEDADFYSHSGVDFKSIVRAVWKDFRSHGKMQGGSTITQQLARAFVTRSDKGYVAVLISREKTVKRKIAEMLLARRIERELTKDEILHRYLNQIFFGHGAYGVEAAARIHFGKHVGELTLAEAALLAGLPQAPSNYAPELHPEEALRRRGYVLEQMELHHWITAREREQADQEPLQLVPAADPTRTLTPFFTELLRRELVDRYGHDAVYREGLQITATVDVKLQQAAQRAVLEGLGVLDHRIGYRPATQKVDPEKAGELLGEARPGAPGDPVKAVVEEVAADHVWVALPGGGKGVIHRVDNLWCYPISPEAWWKSHTASDLGKVFARGDVVQVTALSPKDSKFVLPSKKGKPQDPRLAEKLAGRTPLLVVQQPEVQGALLSFHIPDGRVIAVVGGRSFDESEFIRATQSRRQVGSTFKTVVYAAALARNLPKADATRPEPSPTPERYSLATILQDAPIVMTAKEAELTDEFGGSNPTDEQWKPSNFNKKYYGDTPLRTAFILSRNLPTLQLARKVGIKAIMELAHQLGIESDLAPDLSIALGSASLSLLEVCRAHAVFPAGGNAVQPRFVERIADRDGKVLFDLKKELAAVQPTQILDPRAAFVMTQLMVDVARFGTASEATKLKRVSGGKTGTTNDYNDAWYIGFTPQILTGVWVGYDQLRSLGSGETGGEAALPIWLQFMQSATQGQPEAKFTPPDGVVKLQVDRATGKLARPDEKPEDVVETWFVKGTEPTEYAKVGRINEQPNIFQADPGLR